MTTELAQKTTTQTACYALGVARSSYYRYHSSKLLKKPCERHRPPRSLSSEEHQKVLDTLHSERFVDRAPREIYATLLDEDTYLCSVRTMYRILKANRELHERRNQLRHPAYKKPELLATAPNQVWSWDITKLRAELKWTYYYLYILLDIFSRYVVGWLLAHRESGELAKRLVSETCTKQEINEKKIIIHADRGPAPRSKTLLQLYSDLTIEPSFSRPHVSNDNPYSESQFKTMKYWPSYPDRFTGYEHALSYCREFIPWYNTEHRHSGLAYLTPEMVHYGANERIITARQRVLDEAYLKHPERFVKRKPCHPALPEAVWINKPEDRSREEVTTY